MAEKKTQYVRPGGAWVHRLWKNVVYVSADIGRKYQVKILKIQYGNMLSTREFRGFFGTIEDCKGW